MTDHTLLVLCIPVALMAGLLWGIAWEKHRESRRRNLEDQQTLWKIHTDDLIGQAAKMRRRPF